jgi:hypothetical protein
MKNTTINLFAVALILAATRFPAAAQPAPKPPGQISYQGFVTDANGIPLATNAPLNYTLLFKLYGVATGGTPLWAEQQVVTVDRGYFTVLLGNGTPVNGLPNASDLSTFFAGTNAVPSDASDRYLELTVTDLGTNAIAPRLRLETAPYAFLATRALSALAGGITGTIADTNLSANIALRNSPNNFSGNQTITGGTLGIGTNGTGLNTVQINPTYESANGYGLVVCKSDYGQNIQINRGASSGGIGLIVDDAAAGDASTTMFAVRNNVLSSPTSLFDILANGNVGIGRYTLGDKISLYNSAYGSYGFGVQSYQLQIHTDTSSADIVFGSGSGPTLPAETMRIKGNGTVGIGTASIPKNGIGAAMLALDGPVNSPSGPHVQYTVATDNYPVFQQLNYSHDNLAQSFDAYWDGSGWRSSSANGSFQVYKINGQLNFNAGAAAAGQTVVFSTPLSIQTNGNVNVAGKITSPQWTVGDVIGTSGTDGLGAGQYNVSSSFVSHGGTLRISVSGSGRGGGSGSIGVGVYLDNALLPGIANSIVSVFVNDTGHHSFVARTFTLRNIAAGSHTLKLQAAGNTYVDSNDQLYATVEELPF